MVLRKSFYIRWSAGRSPRVHEVNPGRDPSPKAYTKKGLKQKQTSPLNELENTENQCYKYDSMY